MPKKLICAALLAAGFLSLPATSARAAHCSGPWVKVDLDQPALVWGKESHCNCGGVRGGAYASNRYYGLVWSGGTGLVALQIQLAEQGTQNTTVRIPQDHEDNIFSGTNGGGREGAIMVDLSFDDWYWTGWYQAVCETWN